MTIGDLIKDFRSQKGLSLREFALRATMSHAYISALENNKDPRTNKPIAPTIESYKKIGQKSIKKE